MARSFIFACILVANTVRAYSVSARQKQAIYDATQSIWSTFSHAIGLLLLAYGLYGAIVFMHNKDEGLNRVLAVIVFGVLFNLAPWMINLFAG